MAETHDTTVHAIYVINVGTEVVATGKATGELMDTLTGRQRRTGNRCDPRRGADVAYEQELLEESPHEAIGKYASEQEIDLIIIMETRGRSDLMEHLLGKD